MEAFPLDNSSFCAPVAPVSTSGAEFATIPAGELAAMQYGGMSAATVSVPICETVQRFESALSDAMQAQVDTSRILRIIEKSINSPGEHRETAATSASGAIRPHGKAPGRPNAAASRVRAAGAHAAHTGGIQTFLLDRDLPASHSISTASDSQSAQTSPSPAPAPAPNAATQAFSSAMQMRHSELQSQPQTASGSGVSTAKAAAAVAEASGGELAAAAARQASAASPQIVQSAAAAVLQPETAAAIVNGVVEAVSAQILVDGALAHGQGEVRIMLKSEVLDGSEIKLTAENGVLHVSISPATADAAATLAAALPRLEAAMAHHAGSFLHVAVTVANVKKGKEHETV